MEHLLAKSEIKPFVFGGNATFTLKSKKSGRHLTFKARRKKDVTFLSVRSEEGFSYIGLLTDREVIVTNKSAVTSTDASIQAVNWLLRQLRSDRELDAMEVYHVGQCCRCSRPLTTPESIQRGIGPECMKKV